MAAALGEGLTRLENERDRLEAILAAMVEGVIVIDGTARSLRANARVAERSAAPRPLAGLRLWDLSRDVEFNAVVRDALASQRPTVREVELRGVTQRHLEVTVDPDRGRQRLGAGVPRRHRNQAARARAHRLRGNVFNELRTPPTAIKGFAETLLSSGFADRERALHFVSIIDRQAEWLSRLIDDLLILSDLGSARCRCGRRPVALEPIVREVEDLLRRAGSTGRRHAAGRRVPPELRVEGDPDRLTQVSNLLDNAIKYTPAGGPCRSSAHGTAGRWSCRWRTPGPESPAEDLPRPAERFYRVDKASASPAGTRGIGLSIVKPSVQAHGGTLRFATPRRRGDDRDPSAAAGA